MTTSEFIEMLKKADPDGNAHVRMCGGVPTFAELKEGYWDGPYSYIDVNGKYVRTTQGMKVDIHTIEPTDVLERNVEELWNPYDPIPDDLWEKAVEKSFSFDFTYAIKEHNEERIESFLEEPREFFEWLIPYKQQNWKNHLDEMIEKANKGWKFYQVKDAKWKYYDWIIKDPSGKKDGANLATTFPILESGKFKVVGDPIPATQLQPLSYWKKLKESMGKINRTDERLNETKEFVEWKLIED